MVSRRKSYLHQQGARWRLVSDRIRNSAPCSGFELRPYIRLCLLANTGSSGFRSTTFIARWRALPGLRTSHGIVSELITPLAVHNLMLK